MLISRQLTDQIKPWLHQGKAIIVTGPRQVGKTTLIRELVMTMDKKELWLTGDDPVVREQLAGLGVKGVEGLLSGYEVVVVDEAQRLKNAGLTLKLVTDFLPDVQLLVTGSSALDIAAETKENLTGRKVDFHLFPLSFSEMVGHHGMLSELDLLEQRMVYGYYPEIVTRPVDQAKVILRELADGLMYRDILALDQVKKPSVLVKLLQAIALQLGNEVRNHELSQLLGIDTHTVERYLDLLEQSFVIFRLPSFSRNVRNEIKKGRKIYFYDNGIRNAVIRNYNPVSLRNDVGALWENFLVAERVKKNAYDGRDVGMYFWRTNQQQEIDLIEESGGEISAFEFKSGIRNSSRFPKTFTEAYQVKELLIVDRRNVADFLM